MREFGPFKIITKPRGIMYLHTLMLYNSELGYKVSPSSIPPEWMRHRMDTGNTRHVIRGDYNPPATMEKKPNHPQSNPDLPRAAT